VNESFEPFGARRDSASWAGPPTGTDLNLINGVSRVGYTGHAMLGSMGLIHMNGRVEDSTIGRFLSADPLVTDVDDTQDFNRYSYVSNRPLSYVDPSGYVSICGWVASEAPASVSTGPDGEIIVTAPRDSYGCVDVSDRRRGEQPSGLSKPRLPGTAQEQKPPCAAWAQAVQDFTGGDTNQDWWSDAKSNYNETMNFDVLSVSGHGVGLDTPVSMAAAPYVASTWGGVTPGPAVSQAVAATRAAVRIPGLIGFRTPLQLVGTAGASWLWNALVAKGAYRGGVFAGSMLRAAVNQAATMACTK
jgi:RHS repeat-associated protein